MSGWVAAAQAATEGLSGIGSAALQANYQRKFFDMTNDYNNLGAQMERLRSAEFKPNLVYGNGTVAGISQNMPQAPNVKISSGNAIANYVEMKQLQNQNDLIAQQIKTLQSQAKSYDAQAYATGASGYREADTKSQINYRDKAQTAYTAALTNTEVARAIGEAFKSKILGKDLQYYDANYQRRKENEDLHNANLRIENSNLDTKRKAEIKEILQRIENMKADRSGQLLDNFMKSLDIKDYSSAGFNSHDNIIFRVLKMMTHQAGTAGDRIMIPATKILTKFLFPIFNQSKK